MKKCIYAIALALLSVMFLGCNKTDGLFSDEDLSYLKPTYSRIDHGNYVQKTLIQYDGNKIIEYKQWQDDELDVERTNYSYDGLNAQLDVYYYGHVGHIRDHVECEFLDETFERVKYSKTECFYENTQYDYVSEVYYEYDGKKKVGYKNYHNGILYAEEKDFNYDDLHCTYQRIYYSPTGEVDQVDAYNVLYLDDTYLRNQSYSYTRTYTIDGYSRTYYYVYEYDGKKIVGIKVYLNGELSKVHRDYQYDGLVCHFKIDHYQNGVLNNTTNGETHYLK